MATFEEAVRSWTNTLNDWYQLGAREEEVKLAFKSLKEYREIKDEQDEVPYVETFFKLEDGSWSVELDTVDREMLAGLVEHIQIPHHLL